LTFYITGALRENAFGPKLGMGKSEKWLHFVVDSLIRAILEVIVLNSKLPLVMDRNDTDRYVPNT
jgi:hypothetical protein